MEPEAASRYRSRILREMNANRANPFNSPPSSTGSHGTVSPTLSSVMTDPDGESTRRLNHDIARVTAPRKLPVNWEAAHRKWPDFFSMPPSARDKVPASKENWPPPADDSTQDAWHGSKSRSEMQPRVDNESDLSSELSKSPRRALCKARPRDAPDRLQEAPHGPKDGERSDPSRDDGSPHLSSSAKSSLTAVAASPSSMASPGRSPSQARSFLMPDISHLGDFVTGTLKFSGSMKNGVPIFVKHGKVHDRREQPSAGAYAEIDGIRVPEDEEKIFVSMDMIRDEIVSLQEHHDKVQEYAENLQQQVERLQAQLRSRKYANGSDSYEHGDDRLVARKNSKSIHCPMPTPKTDCRTALEIEVATLQARLDQAQQKISDSEMENVSLAHERDRAVNRLQSACEDISKLTRKLNVKEKQLESSHKQLETTDQMRQDNDTLRRDLVSLKHGRDALELENSSLRADSETLRKQQKDLREEIESLRSDNNSLRRGDGSLMGENRSLRSRNKILTEENEDLRENLDGVQHELDAAREEIDALRQQVDMSAREKKALREDNESLVRHNEKYFNENKTLRRETSGFERSIHELHDENLRLKDEVGFLKQQLDRCRPLAKPDLSARLDDETEEENMTSAFFVPDITMRTEESGAQDAETNEMPAPAELTAQSYRPQTTGRSDAERGTGDATKRKAHQQRLKSMAKAAPAPKHAAAQGQKVAFSVPEKPVLGDKNVANKGSKRRVLSQEAASRLQDVDDTTTELQSVDNTTQDQAISLNLTLTREQRQSRHRDVTSQRMHKSRQQAQKLAAETDLTAELSRRVDRGSSCPALSSDARQVLDGLCEHNCRNCIVCSRITSHRGVVSAAEVASGKKRVSVPRPVPVTDRNLGADATVRPSQAPGHALALVIKGLEDEAQHLQLELTRLQAQYNGSDKALGRRDRVALAEGIRTLLKRLEVKNDQIYSLYDVVEGQKDAGQAMGEEEVEMTVLHITGMTVREVTSGSEQFTWEGIQDMA